MTLFDCQAKVTKMDDNLVKDEDEGGDSLVPIKVFGWRFLRLQ